MKDKFYPQPSFIRNEWLNLDGTWEFAFDDNDVGLREGWENRALDLLIEVPFVFQTAASNLRTKEGDAITFEGEPPYHPIVWYRRHVELKELGKDEEVLLNFNAIDFKAIVWVNGKMVYQHLGGYTAFEIPVSDYVNKGDNIITVRVEDRHDDAQPRGKQIWTNKPWACWYTPVTGIWQDVWMSFTSKARMKYALITPDIDRRTARFEIAYSNTVDELMSVEIELWHDDERISSSIVQCLKMRQYVDVFVAQPREINGVDDVNLWSPENPYVYDVVLKLKKDNEVIDTVRTYFGMRKISVRNGEILLNNRPIYQRLVLDQGYWKDSLITPPSKEALKLDIQRIKELGFNGVRMHQKFEDPWFYWYADRLGLLTWAEMPSAYSFSTDEMINITQEMQEAIKEFYNHPSIITWVPLNESWGVRDIFRDSKEQSFSLALYHMIKAMDPTRLISSNDGWEQTVTDFVALHDYKVTDQKSWNESWGDINHLLKSAPMARASFAEGFSYEGEPILLTEFGGISLLEDSHDGAWGYFNPALNTNELVERIKKLMKVIYSEPKIKGFCYTQLTDVEQEVNGLLYIDRKSKCDLQVFNKLFNGIFDD